jgi:hypothetical protein
MKTCLPLKTLIVDGHDNRLKTVQQLNKDISMIKFRDKIDDVSSTCYKHWLASADSDCELNTVVNDRRLCIGPYEKPLSSINSIYGTQLDGAGMRHGMYRMNETTILNRSCIQCSRGSSKLGFDTLGSTTYLVRIFVLNGDTWQISPVGVYYQLKNFTGLKRKLITVTDTSTQTDLGGEELDDIINKRLPEGFVSNKV